MGQCFKKKKNAGRAFFLSLQFKTVFFFQNFS